MFSRGQKILFGLYSTRIDGIVLKSDKEVKSSMQTRVCVPGGLSGRGLKFTKIQYMEEAHVLCNS